MATTILSVAMLYAVIAICKFFPATSVAKFFESIATDEDVFVTSNKKESHTRTSNSAA